MRSSHSSRRGSSYSGEVSRRFERGGRVMVREIGFHGGEERASAGERGVIGLHGEIERRRRQGEIGEEDGDSRHGELTTRFFFFTRRLSDSTTR
ncbi:unnamed protein product [Arabis nemorensis]|uniref:Uncharacterized protein n=1 Tax=Arabis nemorensis TaxID=586526 RepID=A0A565AVY1_9BRAS|nr:unnamed protein product [Arabis nemorensis]